MTKERVSLELFRTVVPVQVQKRLVHFDDGLARIDEHRVCAIVNLLGRLLQFDGKPTFYRPIYRQVPRFFARLFFPATRKNRLLARVVP